MSSNTKTLLILHIMLAIYSISGILSKFAAGFDFLSLGFILCYGGVLLLLIFYAVAWQQIIKKMPLTVAYANRAATVVWGIVWGILVFGEQITVGKVIGALFVICGIVLYSLSNHNSDDKKEIKK